MNVFNGEPTDWKDLQNKVAKVFKGINCKVEVEKDVKTVRGIVNVDVHVEDHTNIPKIKYLCECKNWNSSVPQSVVHSFRTVVTDYGANGGYLISKEGFQSGSYEY